MEEQSISVSIRQSGKPAVTLVLEKSQKIGNVKEQIDKKCAVPVAEQRLVYKGKMLRDEETLSSLGVSDGHVFHLIQKVTTETRAAAPPRITSTGAPQVSAAVPPPPPFGDLQGMEMNTLLDAMSTLNSNLPQFGEDAMRQMVDDPNFQSTMKYLFNNPDALQDLFRQNPFLNQMMANNPFVRSMMENPSVLRGLMSPEILSVSLQFQQMMAQQQTQAAESGEGGALDLESMMRQAMQVLQEHPETRDQLMNTFNQGQAATGGVTAASAENPAPAPAQAGARRPPGEQFVHELKQLQDMGFIDREANIQALQATGGIVDQSIAWLLENGFGNG